MTYLSDWWRPGECWVWQEWYVGLGDADHTEGVVVVALETVDHQAETGVETLESGVIWYLTSSTLTGHRAGHHGTDHDQHQHHHWVLHHHHVESVLHWYRLVTSNLSLISSKSLSVTLSIYIFIICCLKIFLVQTDHFKRIILGAGPHCFDKCG